MQRHSQRWQVSEYLLLGTAGREPALVLGSCLEFSHRQLDGRNRILDCMGHWPDQAASCYVLMFCSIWLSARQLCVFIRSTHSSVLPNVFCRNNTPVSILSISKQGRARHHPVCLNPWEASDISIDDTELVAAMAATYLTRLLDIIFQVLAVLMIFFFCSLH